MITVCQEWLEGPDGLLAKLVASAVLLIFALYITGSPGFKDAPGGLTSSLKNTFGLQEDAEWRAYG
ncbi:MAG: hypothetical protein PHO01_11080 [Desulfotomaculaceae bacterium]|nr:hypothetical protein [Desulfotomaculaceae bacterium]